VSASRLQPRWPAFAFTPSARFALSVLILIIALAAFGQLLAPDSPSALIGAPAQPPGQGHLLGTDYIGEDVLSRVLYGGRSVLLLGGAATLLAYVIGGLVGLVAGYAQSVRGHRQSISDALLMRGMDILLAFPGILVILLAVAGLGSGKVVLIGATALVQVPQIARLARTATVEIAVQGYVEAAVARGERTAAILRREILPNSVPVIMADVGLRFTYSIILIASVNFLGLGISAPHADWGLMVSENRGFIGSNPWAVTAPAIMLALLAISVNLVGDAFARSRGVSVTARAVKA
jgi:peptide/nickel transport system permease protein